MLAWSVRSLSPLGPLSLSTTGVRRRRRRRRRPKPGADALVGPFAGDEYPPEQTEQGDRLRMAARSSSMAAEDDYETEQKKQAAADVLFHYSQFVMVCIGEDVRPTDLRLHLMKEVSGMPTSLKEPQQAAASPASSGEPSSSGTMKGDKSEIS